MDSGILSETVFLQVPAESEVDVVPANTGKTNNLLIGVLDLAGSIEKLLRC